MAIHPGSSNLKEIFAGADRIRSAYLGSSLLWQYDSTAPALAITAPAGASSGAPTYTTGSTYRVQGTVTDTDSGVAAVYVNGQEATLSGSTWYRDITLAANTVTAISVYAVDNAGNQTATITRYVCYDSAVPSLAVSTPASASSGAPTYTTGQTYRVQGTASDASGLASVTVNGEAATISGSTWYRDITLTANATTTITVVATDKAGRTTSVTRYVRYDSAAPALSVTAPTGTSSGAPTYVQSDGAASYTVSGMVSDASGLRSVTVNGGAATVSGNSWSRTLTGLATNTTHTITVVATDNAGRTTTVTRYLRVDGNAPSLTVAAPASGDASNPSMYAQTSLTVSGTVSDASGIRSVTVNGQTATISGNNWSAVVSLDPTVVTAVTVVATDNAGRTTTIVRYAQAYLIYFHSAGEKLEQGSYFVFDTECTKIGNSISINGTDLRPNRAGRIRIYIMAQNQTGASMNSSVRVYHNYANVGGVTIQPNSTASFTLDRTVAVQDRLQFKQDGGNGYAWILPGSYIRWLS